MKSNKSFTVYLRRTFLAHSSVILNLFAEGMVFKLAGADAFQYDFKVNGNFLLTFNNRGTIHGQFIAITDCKIIIEWNVKGFQRPNEINTWVDISLEKNNNGCIFTLNHTNIMHEEAAAAKERAWNEILDKVEQLLESRR